MTSCTQPIKVLLISHEYPPYVFGGIATYVKELAEGLSQCKDIHVTVVAGRCDRHDIYYEREKENLTIVRLWFPNKPIRPLWFQFFGKKIILKLARYHNIIHINPSDCSSLLPHLKKIGKYIISTFHGSMLEQLKLFASSPTRDLVKYSTLQDIVFNTIRGQQMVLSEQLSYDLSDYSIFVAKHVMEEFTHYYGSRRGLRKIIYPGIKYKKTANDLPFTESGNNFFYTGRLFFLKGPQYSLEAFRKYLEYEKNMSELHIYGEGPLMHRLKIAFKDHVPQKIKFLGMIERHKYLKRIPLYKAMIFPSLYEGCPISMIEALSAGILVLSFNTQWIREFKDIFNNLYVVKIYDVEKLATSLINITAMNNVKRAKNIPSDFKSEKFVEKVKNVYLEFIK